MLRKNSMRVSFKQTYFHAIFLFYKIDLIFSVMYNYPKNVIKANKRGQLYGKNKNENSIS
ncbi:hypothetical protein UT300003_21280 [Clostridium sardiniense]